MMSGPRRRTIPAVLVAACLLSGARGGWATDNASVSLEDQWYTGSLLSPSGAAPHQGMLGFEPYLIFTDQTGAFDSTGRSRAADPALRSLSSTTLFKYGLTDHLSIQFLPTISYGWNRASTTSGLKFGDLPVELQFRFMDPDNARLRPALTAFLGMDVPLGDYDRLLRPLDGVGTGAWALRIGLLSQSAYLVSDKPLRLRVYANARQPVAAVGLHGASVYDTNAGFQGQANPGIAASFGFSLEYGLTQRWVLAFDAVRDIQDGNRLHGHYPQQADFGESTGSIGDWTVAPAIEYNFSSRFGFIAGAAVTVAGHNTRNQVEPQIALNCVF
jgi:hypothetical protein